MDKEEREREDEYQNPIYDNKIINEEDGRRSRRRTSNRRRVPGSDTQRMDFLHSILRVTETDWNDQEMRKGIV